MAATDSPAPRRGRPALDPRVRRTELVRARLSPTESERLAAYCASRGITESELVRERLAPVIGELAAA